MSRARLPYIAVMTLLLAAVGCSDDQRTPATGPVTPSEQDVSTSNTSNTFDPNLGRPLSGLMPGELASFTRGRAVFVRHFTPTTGLGPLFNGSSCATCHVSPTVGGAGPQIETHQTAMRAGVCSELEDEGGFVIQDSATAPLQAAMGFTHEPLLPDADGVGHRSTPDVFGRGLLEAVSDQTLINLAQAEKSNPDGVAGRANVDEAGHVGRFGRKAPANTVEGFNGDAFLYEVGVTNPLESDPQLVVAGDTIPPSVQSHGVELSQQDLDDASNFVRFLAPPSQAMLTNYTSYGKSLFSRAGCASCHVPSLQTGSNPVRALSFRTVNAFSDLLLHDMGPELADICFGNATRAEFRTEPLMGLRHRTRYLHDGRALTLDAAIATHGGQGQVARSRFRALTWSQRAALIAYLKTL